MFMSCDNSSTISMTTERIHPWRKVRRCGNNKKVGPCGLKDALAHMLLRASSTRIHFILSSLDINSFLLNYNVLYCTKLEADCYFVSIRAVLMTYSKYCYRWHHILENSIVVITVIHGEKPLQVNSVIQ